MAERINPAATATRNAASMLVSRVAMAAAGLVTLPVMYARLGDQAFGVWVLLTSMVSVLALLDLGLSVTLVRHVAARRDDPPDARTRAALAVAVVWTVVLGTAVGAVLFPLWPWWASLFRMGELAAEAETAMALLLAGLLLDDLALPWRAVLEGAQCFGVLARAAGATAVVGSVAAAVLVFLGGGLVGAAGGLAAASALRTAWVVRAARRRMPGWSPAPRHLRRDDLRTVGGYGLRIQATGAAGAVNLEVDRFVVSGFFGPAVTGGFDVGSRLLNLVRMPPAFLLVALFPTVVSAAASADLGWLERFQVLATKYVAMMVFPVAALLVVGADPLVRVWIGEPNGWAAAGIAVLAPSYALNLVSGATALLARAEGHPGRESRYGLLSLALNVGLTWPLLRLWGPVGVLVATSIGIALSTVYFVAAFQRFSGRPVYPLWTACWPAVMAAVAGGLAGAAGARLVPVGAGRLAAATLFGGQCVLVAVVALGVLVLTGQLTGADRHRLERLMRHTMSARRPAVAR